MTPGQIKSSGQPLTSLPRSQFKNASMSTVEEIQSFCNNFIPAPFYVRVIRIVIPLSTRLEAGEVLIDGLGEEDIENVVGGREWWQRTAHRDNGLDAEWISMKRDWEGLEAEARAQRKSKGKKGEDDEESKAVQERLKKMKADAKAREKRRRAEGKARFDGHSLSDEPDPSPEAAELSDEAATGDEHPFAHDTGDGVGSSDPSIEDTREGEDAYTSDLDEMPVTLAIHGGAYLLGSINTHRYVYWRLARKTGGRVFAVEYRLSPQFPFPCSRKSGLKPRNPLTTDLTRLQSQYTTAWLPIST